MLRGIACLGVCFMHFAGTVDSEMLNQIGKYGGYGVPIFFAISGFVLPYSLNRADYHVSNYFRFLTKRLVRLEPAYLVSILGVFALSFLAQLSAFSTSEQFAFFNLNTLYHLFYLVDFFDGDWLNPVYWTLAIEFQFYLLIGLLFFLLKSKNRFVLIALFAALNLSSLFITDDRFVPHYFLMFLPGIILFWYQSKRISLYLFIAFILILITTGFYKHGISGPICSVLSIGFILFVTKPMKPLLFLGTISYSLYLIHTIVGTDGIINFMQNFVHSENGRIWLMILTFPVVIGISWLFYIIIERPSMKLSKRIKYKVAPFKRS